MAAMRARNPELEKTYTVEKFEQLPEFSDRYNLLDGRLVKETVAGGEHSLIIDIIRDALKAYDPKKKLGFSLQESSVKVSSNSAPLPDISYWKAERGVQVVKGAMPLPDLAVEVHSPGDLKSRSSLQSAMVKVEKVVMAGVPVVWVINPETKTVEVYHGGNFVPVQSLNIEDELTGENVIPGFTLPVRSLFEP